MREWRVAGGAVPWLLGRQLNAGRHFKVPKLARGRLLPAERTLGRLRFQPLGPRKPTRNTGWTLLSYDLPEVTPAKPPPAELTEAA